MLSKKHTALLIIFSILSIAIYNKNKLSLTTKNIIWLALILFAIYSYVYDRDAYMSKAKLREKRNEEFMKVFNEHY